MNNSFDGEYKYKDQGLHAIACMLFGLFWAALTLAAVDAPTKASTFGMVMLVLGNLLFFGMAMASLLSTSRVVVDRLRLSRKVFGIIWWSIAWSEIGEIHVMQRFNASTKRQDRFISFFPPRHAHSVGSAVAGISDNGQLEGVNQMICFINDRIRENHAKIYLVGKSGKTELPRL